MTVTSDRVAASPRRGVLAVWSAPLWVHTMALLAMLIVLALFTRPGVGYTSDEGAGIGQARLLEQGTWFATNPVPSVDPDGRFSPFPRADAGEKGSAPYAKHPLFPLIMSVADDLGGARGLVALSIAGTVGAAVAGALIAAMLRPSLARPALWVLGLGSPLLFDAYIVLAHTLATATFGLATLAALLSWSEGASRARRALWLTAMVALVMVTVGLRTEGAFAGLGLAAGAIVVAWRRPTARGPAVVTGVAAGAATLLAIVIERWARLAITGSPVAVAGEAMTAGTGAWLPGRVDAVWNDWFDPGVGASAPVLVVALLATMVLLMFGAWKARSDGGTVLGVVLMIAVACYAIRLVSSPPIELFGLIPAMPLLWVGLLLLRRADLSTAPALLLMVTIAAFSAGVFLTDYSVGGSLQWGGRYFALALPLAVPLALVAIRRVVTSAPSLRSSRLIVVGLVACCVLTSALGMRALRSRQDDAVVLTDAIAAATAVAGPVGIGDHPDRPLVVVRNRLAPQLLYGDLDRYVWLAAGRPDAVRDALQRAAAAGVTRATVINAPRDDSLWPGWREVDREDPGPVNATVIETCAPAAC